MQFQDGNEAEDRPGFIGRGWAKPRVAAPNGPLHSLRMHRIC